MGSFFSLDNPVWNGLGKVWDIMWLGVLWTICSIPIFTIGASTTAVYYVCLKMAKNEEGYVTKQFFHSFKQNFKQGTIIWLIMLLVGAVLGFNLYFYFSLNNGAVVSAELGSIMSVIMLIFVWVYLMVSQYLYPCLAQFDNTTKNLFVLAFTLSIKKLGWTIVMIIIDVAIIAAGIFFFVPILFIAMGVIAILNAFILNHIFKPFIEEMNGEKDQQD